MQSMFRGTRHFGQLDQAFTKFTPAPERKFGCFGVVLQSFLHSEPNFLPKLRMDTDRIELEPRVLIKKLQGGFPGVNGSRVVLNPLLVDKLRGLVDHFPRKDPASLRSNSIKGNGATFGPNLNDDFVLVHWTRLPPFFERLGSLHRCRSVLRRKSPFAPITNWASLLGESEQYARYFVTTPVRS